MAVATMASLAVEVAALLGIGKSDEALQRAVAALRPEVDVADAVAFFGLPTDAADVIYLLLALHASLVARLEDSGLALGFVCCLASMLGCAPAYRALVATVPDVAGLAQSLASLRVSNLRDEATRVRQIAATGRRAGGDQDRGR
jgi:hypothetical protein